MSDLGQILRSKREEQGVTLKDIEDALSIRVKYLEALENGDYALIPGEVYVKGFLRNYANYLGLNADEMVQLYKSAKQPSKVTEPAPEEEQQSVSQSRFKGNRGLTFGLGATALLLAIVAGAFLLHPQNPSPDPAGNAQVSPKASVPTPRVPAASEPEKVVKPAGQMINLSAKATADCWVEVYADGTGTFEGLLKAGDIKTWQAKKSIEIILGNAGGVEISYNDQPQAPLGAIGEVIHKVYNLQ